MPPLPHSIEHRPDMAVLRVHLPTTAPCYAEPGSMIAMDPSVRMTAGLRGGLLGSIGRALGGESLIINTYRAEKSSGDLLLAPGPMGDIQHHTLNPNTRLLLKRGAFLAHSEGVSIQGKWEGMRGLLGGQGMVLLRACGDGDLFFNSFGALYHQDVDGSFFVDTGYIVAFEETLQYTVTTLPSLGTASRIKSFVFGGEGLVCQFRGRGRVWMQTRAVGPFLAWAQPFRRSGKGRPKSKNND